MTDLHTHRPYMPEKYRATYRKLDEYQNEIQWTQHKYHRALFKLLIGFFILNVFNLSKPRRNISREKKHSKKKNKTKIVGKYFAMFNLKSRILNSKCDSN